MFSVNKACKVVLSVDKDMLWPASGWKERPLISGFLTRRTLVSVPGYHLVGWLKPFDYTQNKISYALWWMWQQHCLERASDADSNVADVDRCMVTWRSGWLTGSVCGHRVSTTTASPSSSSCCSLSTTSLPSSTSPSSRAGQGMNRPILLPSPKFWQLWITCLCNGNDEC